ncbi:MAG TPA: type II secretion system F family protein [Phenylobacterium sp.]|nr:type II secretion system F family protein [Phenylobacterium sp.]
MSQFMSPLIYVLAFVAVVVLVQTVAGLIFTAGDKTRRVNRRLTMLDSGVSREEVYSALVRKVAAPKVGGARLLAIHDKAETYMRQAGLSLAPLQLLAIAAGIAGALWLIALSLASSGAGPGFLINGAISMVGACGLSLMGVWLWVQSRRNARIKKVEEQLPLALDIVNRAVRAGHPVVSAVQLAADELGDPVGSEFGLIVDETTYGVEFKEALANFARRTGSPDGHFFAVSVSIQSETGGNLAEILDGLASVMRGRQTLGKRVRALASEGRASAVLLSVLPVLLIGAQLLIHPRVYVDKFSDPIFWPVVVFTGLIYLGGWLMVQRIINFKY